jgi:2-polyprenyl-3-methyl-5-hydroxy-6-metoxy-1,4-benzoquinol methylase
MIDAMVPPSLKLAVYELLKPWADRLYLWLRADQSSNQIVGTPAGGPARVIRSLPELDQELAEVDRLFAISDDAGRGRLASWTFAPPLNFPDDPYSAAYADAQRRNYLELSGRSSYVSAVNEHSDISLEASKRAPFPYFTKSPTTVGHQFLLWGVLIRALDLQPGARIAEFGPGWGNTTLHLAQMGYDLTAVEIEPDFIQLIEHRAERLDVPLHTVQADMLSFRPDEPFDCALFFESFHHCADHLQMLRNLDHIVKPDGLLVFGAEPIAEFPHPWGFVRNDGLTVWSIRKHGWFELGFDSSYFLRTLLFFGWLPRRNPGPAVPGTDVIVARRAHGRYEPHAISLPPDEEAGWQGPEEGLRFTRDQAVLSCARWQPVHSVSLCLSNFAPHPLTVTVTAGAARKAFTIPANASKQVVTLAAAEWQGQVAIACPTWQPAAALGNGDRRHVGVAVHWVELQVDALQA